MADKLRVGVIGTGYVSKNNYLPVLAQTEDIEFVGVMAKNYENAVRAAKSFGAQHAVQTIEELVDLGLDDLHGFFPGFSKKHIILVFQHESEDLPVCLFVFHHQDPATDRKA